MSSGDRHLRPKYSRYQDYVIKNGRLVGEFEQMYRDYEDPWQQSQETDAASEKIVGLHLLGRAHRLFGCRRVIELGCGHGHYAEVLRKSGFDVIGLDVSETAIAKARGFYPALDLRVGAFADVDMLSALAPDAIVMAEITWYVLEELRTWLATLAERLPSVFLLHMLSLYPPGEQKYGVEYFTDLDSLKHWFGLTYLESGQVFRGDNMIRTYFLGGFRPEVLSQWNKNA